MAQRRLQKEMQSTAEKRDGVNKPKEWDDMSNFEKLNRLIVENGGEVPKDENAEFNAYFVYWLLAYLWGPREKTTH